MRTNKRIFEDILYILAVTEKQNKLFNIGNLFKNVVLSLINKK